MRRKRIDCVGTLWALSVIGGVAVSFGRAVRAGSPREYARNLEQERLRADRRASEHFWRGRRARALWWSEVFDVLDSACTAIEVQLRKNGKRSEEPCETRH
jgi:hypothetical protein